jgi:metallo-beta-lactamase family protein
MQLTFWGAARQVTGSMYLLELQDGYKILIDCGLDMEKERKETTIKYPDRPSYSVFPFEPSQINLVLLTHAHIDHSGNIPNLFREGFEGQVLCTSPTLELTKLLLQDSAMLHQTRLSNYHKRKGKTKKTKPAPPVNVNEWYLEQHVKQAVEQFVPISFNNRFRAKRDLAITFYPAGHLLGAAHVVIEVEENGTKKTIGFSGDIGRKNYPLLPDPYPLPQVDYLLCETTYGNRKHIAVKQAEETLSDVIEKTCVDIPGRLIIPAFSVGRTQALLYTLHKLAAAKQLPQIKVFSDSPLAFQSTKVYEKYVKQLNPDAKQFKEDNDVLFDFDNLIYVEDLKTSKAISNYREPCVIISASGMMEGGRIQHHIAANLQNPYCTILMVGYSSEGTVGHDLLMGKKEIRIGEVLMPVLATVVNTDVFSGHGDQDDLLYFVKNQNKNSLKKLFLVHGEYQSMLDFKTLLLEHDYQHIEVPEKGQVYEL